MCENHENKRERGNEERKKRQEKFMNKNESKKNKSHSEGCSPASVPSPSSKVSMEMNWLSLWQDIAGSTCVRNQFGPPHSPISNICSPRASAVSPGPKGGGSVISKFPF